MNYIGTKLKIIIIAVSGNIQILLFCLALLIGFTGCKSTQEIENTAAVNQRIGEITLSDIEAAVASQSTKSIKPIDIKAPGFFWLVQPWKEGTLATLDFWARFAEISFKGANKMKITPFAEFPRKMLYRELITWPDAGLIAGTYAKTHYLAWVDGNKTKSHIPFLTFAHQEYPPVMLDSREGLVVYAYSSNQKEDDVNHSLFVYNYKEDRIVHESRDKLPFFPRIAMNEKYALSYHIIFDGISHENSKIIFYDCRTNEVLENDLTQTISRHKETLDFEYGRDIHLVKRYLFMYSKILNQNIKLTWNENYSDVKVIPISYLTPEGKRLGHVILSADGTWASTLVGGYKGLRGESICKRVFFHLDERYPNGISMPVITNDYEKDQSDYSAFVNHPVHGMCFAQEWHKGKKQYLRLYKMDDVLAEINRQLLEKRETF